MSWKGNCVDVTTDHTVASLKPLVIATSVDAGEHPVLQYRDRATGKLLGTLRLVRMAALSAENTTLTLYHVSAGSHRCLGWPRGAWNAWLQNRQMTKNRLTNHLNTEPAAVQQLMIAYLIPRPVVLVSVNTPDHRNIFPMDLIGPLERSGIFSLALRSTNVSVQTIRETRRVALSHIPATMKAAVYKAAEHHKSPLHDWDALQFPVQPSKESGIPVVASALRVQELAIVHSQEIGLHTFFLCRVIADEGYSAGDQLHHTAGFHQAYRRRSGTPFTEI
ncbi:flavin reductase [Pinirhizobacter sp.]|uniref:flavin reductase n=1 Tax=Pinirhizobacter sp. TaxID=2950432 RepID=UPI002F42E081